MLSHDEQAALLLSIGRVRRAAASGLAALLPAGADADPGPAIGFIVHLHRGLDDVARRAADTGPVPECQAGCAHCCRVRVEATDPEVLRIARALRELPAAQHAACVAALRGHAAGQDCGFLVAGHCSIYALRPAACRKAHSLSAQQCAAQAPQIPQNLKLLLDAEALMAGTAQAYGDLQLAATPHELNAAVLAALDDPAAELRWRRGEPVFSRD
jgi:Fe-S-cluster containining protein